MTDEGRTHLDAYDDGHDGDVGPGVTESAGYSVREGIQTYAIGLVLATLLTAASFYVVRTSLIWGPGIPIALVVLAVAQMGVHLVFFLHITSDPDNTNNALALAFGVLIVLLVIIGSVWIMYNLNGRLMPPSGTPQQMMQMQR
jgi:cytochrome o ubiquinol oxidase operon protein cyoD